MGKGIKGNISGKAGNKSMAAPIATRGTGPLAPSGVKDANMLKHNRGGIKAPARTRRQ